MYKNILNAQDDYPRFIRKVDQDKNHLKISEGTVELLLHAQTDQEVYIKLYIIDKSRISSI